ncbi:MAG: Lrp/AsnC family transcriptional regulator [Desulfobacteraceae bacterium]|nr:Lrp/AsnC family transcriptional regulator [Desulfobacteraceae bacterium]
MDLKIEKLLDKIGKKIVRELVKNARISFSELGRVVGLSTPAVTERVRKLEEAGIITGYHAGINGDLLGESVIAFIHLDTEAACYDRVKSRAGQLDQVLECHHISGEGSFILKVMVACVADLETLVARFSPFGRTKTTIVLSSLNEKTPRPVIFPGNRIPG